MMPINTRGDVAPTPTQAAGQPLRNPALTQPAVPQMQTVDVPDDPRGAKRRREEESPESSEPSLKRVRVDSSDDDSSDEPVDEELHALANAIGDRDVKKVKDLIEQSLRLRDVVIPGEEGTALLCYAASIGQLDIVRVLASAGCPINMPSKDDGYTPLMRASEQGDVKMIVQLCRLGADPLIIHEKYGWDALSFALAKKHVEACKALINHGADLVRLLSLLDSTGANPIPATPLLKAISLDFVELIDWWLDETKVHVDISEPAINTSLLTVAVVSGALSVVRSLLQRGANPNFPCVHTLDNRLLEGPIQVAANFDQPAVMEYLLGEGLRERLSLPTMLLLCHVAGWSKSTDIYNHFSTRPSANTPADGIKNHELRLYPEQAIEQLAMCNAGMSSTLTNVAVAWWCDQGLLGTMLHTKTFTELPMGIAHLVGPTIQYSGRSFSDLKAIHAQQTQIFVEMLSNQICSPDWPQCFSGLNLTAKGEQTMNQIAAAQSELMLKGIANLRGRFEKQVASLPNLCMNIYISRTNQLNEADLYNRMTGEWGLYKPIAHAVIRLVKVAYEKLCALAPERITSEFAALPPAEQLQHVMVDVLEDWDKIPEIVDTLLQCNAQTLELVSNCLFQQWRLFGEAFGVTKPRYSQFGPHRQEVVEVEPQMEVNQQRATSLAPVPLTPQ